MDEIEDWVTNSLFPLPGAPFAGLESWTSVQPGITTRALEHKGAMLTTVATCNYSIPMYNALVVLGMSWHVYAVLVKTCTVNGIQDFSRAVTLSQLAESGAACPDFQTFERLIRNFAKGLPKVLCKVSLCRHCSRCLCYAGSMPLSWVFVADMC